MTIPTQVVWRPLQTTATQTPVAPLPFAAVVIVNNAMITRTTFEFWHSAIILLYLGQAILSWLLLPYFLQLLLFFWPWASFGYQIYFWILDNWFRHFFWHYLCHSSLFFYTCTLYFVAHTIVGGCQIYIVYVDSTVRSTCHDDGTTNLNIITTNSNDPRPRSSCVPDRLLSHF